MEELTDLKQPIAIRNEYIASYPTTIYVKQHKKSKNSADEDITVWKELDGSNKSPEERKLFVIDRESAPFTQYRYFRDASSLPLFELALKKSGVTWFVHLPGGKDTSESIAAIAPRWNPLKNKLDVYVRNSAGDGEEVKLKVRGQDLSRSKTHVYFKGALVMTALRTNGHVSPTELEWEVQVTRGLDVSLASVIMVVMAYMLHITAASSYHGAGDSRADGK
ncbi:tubby C-terminal-like domain-containing protein [Aspergillus candidus]|uniref:Tubby C-terminal-like domain-containing protein n=1 Tax=Aspergillus candidus TaxID=41067 RepID=A0A2I2EZ44_ASPCN|nr:tubby C-terminal-like domain-containing protein [Aspergillus candidus]PLB33632.1 tubby C-terminal-like domain-containing protein [Aspergillus candidus]